MALANAVAIAGCSTGQEPSTNQGTPKEAVHSPVTPAPQSLRSSASGYPANLPRPNILLLMTDDQALSDLDVMPNTRRLLGLTGTTFDRAISTYPLCCPARTTVLTGQHAHNHQVLGNELPWGGATVFDGDDNTLPVWLQQAGYTTAFLGKYLNGYPPAGSQLRIPPGWDYWASPVTGTYHYFGQVVNVNGKLVEHRTYQTSYVRDLTNRLLLEFAPSPRPFFLWANFLAPHGGLPHSADDPPGIETPAVETRYRDEMADRSVLRSPAFNEADMRDKSTFMRNLPAVSDTAMDELYQQRLESLLSVDDAVASIMRTLERTGELDRTLVVFVSDNGFVLGQHRWTNKILGYEESIRVPLILAGPGAAAGATRHQQVTLADLTATFLDAAGATPGRIQDGISLFPLTQDPRFAAYRAVPLEAGGWPFPNQQRLYVGVRSPDDFVLLRWARGWREVYDLRSDPFQVDGTVSPEERLRLPGLERDLKRLRSCAGVDCNQPTQQ